MLLKKKHRPRAQRLLPLDAYPATVDEAGRDRVDARLREQLDTIPTAPGEYLDNEGERWVLDADGCWSDHHGVKRPREYTPILGMWGPWVGLPERGQP
jgi:hypothetical protein